MQDGLSQHGLKHSRGKCYQHPTSQFKSQFLLIASLTEKPEKQHSCMAAGKYLNGGGKLQVEEEAP